jgi:hypothetical protein
MKTLAKEEECRVIGAPTECDSVHSSTGTTANALDLIVTILVGIDSVCAEYATNPNCVQIRNQINQSDLLPTDLSGSCKPTEQSTAVKRLVTGPPPPRYQPRIGL